MQFNCKLCQRLKDCDSDRELERKKAVATLPLYELNAKEIDPYVQRVYNVQASHSVVLPAHFIFILAIIPLSLFVCSVPIFRVHLAHLHR